MLSGDDIESNVRLSADQFVIEFSCIGIILPVAFVADLRVTEDIREQDLGEEVGYLRLVDFGVLNRNPISFSMLVWNSKRSALRCK